MNAERVIGNLIDAVIGHVADGNPSSTSRVEIDIIDADAVPDDDPGTTHGRDHVGLHRGELRDHRIRVRHEWDQCLRGLTLSADDLKPVADAGSLLLFQATEMYNR